MFRKLMLSTTLASVLALGGCAGAINTIPIIGPIISSGITIPNVQNAVTSLCKFMPLANDVSALIGANPTVATINAFANMICSGLTSTVVAARRGGNRGAVGSAVSHVGGISVRGYLVQ